MSIIPLIGLHGGRLAHVTIIYAANIDAQPFHVPQQLRRR